MERIARIKEDLITMVEEQIAHNGLHSVKTEELGEVVDMIKDLSEACYYCEKAKEAQLCIEDMEYDGYENERDASRREGRMFYPGGNMYARGGNSGSRGGNSGMSSSYASMRGGRGRGGRYGYESRLDPKEVEHYINDLSDELIEMLKDIAPEDKAMFQQKIASLANKMK